ncbi:2-nitropropane dioxygenase [Paraburkholderia ginsengiterrae]|uniref:Nitronate monooxygenase n=1 Tax=Paraburkholderia ginsengiterrae TaxID=1462993 RepID=A0A1A9NFI4_9BURK|nr:nitronate monooxygenase [Paraburkholderia ginsengiterrae]OAJ61659.1 2-nitropropane dioxygenase [Paraburkholderia ginsengiterrae]OAJ65257.1 2-nitropropane dioxygenase [Paraburkholderia ginsengiterrae]
MIRKTHLLHALGVQHPIIQAPMAGVSTPALAAAVSNAGALGSIAVGASTAQQARELIAATRALTSKPFNVNVFCHLPAHSDPLREATWLAHLQPLFAEFGAKPPAALSEIYQSFMVDEALLQVLIDERPAVVSFHFGLPPREWIEALHDAGILLLGCATTPREAMLIEQAGLDAIVAQGAEAGGHRGVFDPEDDLMIGTLALVRLIAKQTTLPVIAAGGIMDGEGIAAAMLLGASAVQMGTAFVVAPESGADPAYRSALTSQRTYRTAVTAAISGRPARGLINRMHTDVGSTDAPRLPDYPIAYDAAKALNAAARARGNTDFAVQWAGQGAPMARALPAAELVATLVSELAEAQAQMRSPAFAEQTA